MTAPTGIELLIRWLQVFIGFLYPIALVVLLGLAWRDFHRWVNHQISLDQEERKLDNDIKEFIE